jgi:hypothetical protein
MPLASPIAVALAIADELRLEIDATRRDRIALRSLDANALFAIATRREGFDAKLVSLKLRLKDALAQAAAKLSVSSVTTEALVKASPTLGAKLSDAFAQIRSLSQSLSELDALNKNLGERALSCVRAYLTQVAPRPTAYGRTGEAAESAASATLSRRV